jgi:hypothetical protein
MWSYPRLPNVPSHCLPLSLRLLAAAWQCRSGCIYAPCKTNKVVVYQQVALGAHRGSPPPKKNQIQPLNARSYKETAMCLSSTELLWWSLQGWVFGSMYSCRSGCVQVVCVCVVSVCVRIRIDATAVSRWEVSKKKKSSSLSLIIHHCWYSSGSLTVGSQWA